MTTWFLVALLIIGAGAPDPTPVRVYVFVRSTEGGFVDEESKARAKALHDLRDALAKKKKTITLVEAPELANVLVEITGRDWVDAGQLSTWNIGFGYSVTTKSKRQFPVITARLQVGSYVLDMRGTNTQSAATSKRAWHNITTSLAKQIDQWVKDNRARVIGLRQQEQQGSLQ